MLEAVSEAFAADGHQVTVLCGEGGYASAERAKTEKLGAKNTAKDLTVNVIRVGTTTYGRGTFVRKLADYASFYVGAAWKLLTLRPRPDRVVVLTTPPYLSVLARLLTKLRGADHAHWVMDLYPDVMVAHGMLTERGLPFRLLASLSRFGFGGKRCSAVVTLGPDMAQRVSAYLAEDSIAAWVPLWGTDSGDARIDDGEREISRATAAARALRHERGWEDSETIFMYSGNMGLGHRFDEFLSAAERFQNGSPEGVKPRFAFFGNGKRRREIEAFIREHPEAPVELHDYVPRQVLGAHLLSADVHLASLEPSWDGTMVPSKLQGIFAVGRPVIFVGSSSSSIGRWIIESGGGWVVEPGNQDAMALALQEASAPSEAARRGAAARHFAGEHFARDRNALAVARLLSASR